MNMNTKTFFSHHEQIFRKFMTKVKISKNRLFIGCFYAEVDQKIQCFAYVKFEGVFTTLTCFFNLFFQSQES